MMWRKIMKIFCIFFIFLLATITFAQNLQLHYDFGEDRHYFTSTLEMFKPDDYGATFWFVDIDYNDGAGEKSACMAYLEIARFFKWPFFKNNNALSKLSTTIQYNDGLDTFSGFGNVWLAGMSYPVNLGFVTIDTDILFRKAENQDANFQFTFVWFKPFFDGKVSFSGFMDIWGQGNFDFDADGTEKQVVLLTEPQLWYNVNKYLFVGGEVEISRNFIYGAGDKLKVMPTLGLKWNF